MPPARTRSDCGPSPRDLSLTVYIAIHNARDLLSARRWHGWRGKLRDAFQGVVLDVAPSSSCNLSMPGQMLLRWGSEAVLQALSVATSKGSRCGRCDYAKGCARVSLGPLRPSRTVIPLLLSIRDETCDIITSAEVWPWHFAQRSRLTPLPDERSSPSACIRSCVPLRPGGS